MHRLTHFFLTIFVVISLLFATFTVGRIIFTFHLFDFNIYYLASQDLLASKPLYQNPLIDNNYPPSALLFTVPFAVLPQEAAERVWTLCSVGALVGSIVVLLRAIDQFSLKNTLVIFSIAMWSFPVKFSFGLGQINFLILFLYALSFFAYSKKKQGWAGVVLGLAAAIKLTPLVVLFFFWRKRQWRAILTAVFSFLCLQLAALLLFGSANTSHYLTQIMPHIPTVGNAAYYNQALTGLLARGGVSAPWAWVINYTSLVTMAVFWYRLMKSPLVTKASQLVEFGGWILISLIGAGLAWQHHFVWVLVPMLGAWFTVKKSDKISQILILVSLVLIGSNLKHPNAFAAWPLLLSHVCLGGVLLGIALVRVLRQQLSPQPATTDG